MSGKTARHIRSFPTEAERAPCTVEAVDRFVVISSGSQVNIACRAWQPWARDRQGAWSADRQRRAKAQGSAFPRIDETAFARCTLLMALADRAAAAALEGWVFFDRGLIDAAVIGASERADIVLKTLGRRISPSVLVQGPPVASRSTNGGPGRNPIGINPNWKWLSRMDSGPSPGPARATR